MRAPSRKSPRSDALHGRLKRVAALPVLASGWRAFKLLRAPERSGASRDAKRPVAQPRTKKASKRRAKHHSTRGSRVIPQRSTNLAQPCLTSEIGRDRVYSEWYDRGMQLWNLCEICTLIKSTSARNPILNGCQRQKPEGLAPCS